MENRSSCKIQWKIKISLFRNPVILRDMAIAVGIPFGILLLVLLILSGGDLSAGGMGYALIFIGIFLAAAFLFILLLYGSYEAGYIIDSKGILYYTPGKQAKKNKWLNGLLVIAGICSGRPSLAGAGVLAQSRQSVFVKWKSIKKVKLYPKAKTIVVKGGFAEKIALFCSNDNFEAISALVLNKIKGLERG